MRNHRDRAGLEPGWVRRGNGGSQNAGVRVELEAGDRIALLIGGVDKAAQRRINRNGHRSCIRSVGLSLSLIHI